MDDQINRDTALAVELMGWHLIPKMPGAFWAFENHRAPKAEQRNGRSKIVLNGDMYQRRKGMCDPIDKPGDGFCWSPSVSLADAMAVVAELVARGWEVNMVTTPSQHCVTVGEGMTVDGHVWCEAGETLQEAIAKAALGFIRCLNLSPAEPATAEANEQP